MTDVSQHLPDAKELSYREALIIVGAISCFLVGMVLFRFCCNMTMNVCLFLGDTALVRRDDTLDYWNCICRFFCTSTHYYEEDQAIDTSDNDNADLDILMLQMSSQEKSILMDSILTNKVKCVDCSVFYRMVYHCVCVSVSFR